MEDGKFIYEFDDLCLTVEGIEEIMGYNEGDDREYILGLAEDESVKFIAVT